MSIQATRRPTRRFWLDIRFVIGFVLIAVSILGVYALVTATDTSTKVYTARSALTVGDIIDRGDLVLTSVRFADAGQVYLTGDDLPEAGAVITRTVRKGELVPASAVASHGTAGLTSVVVVVKGPLPASVTAGSLVDLWTAKQTDHDSFGPPSVLVAEANVVGIQHDDSLVADRGSVSIELRVPTRKTAAVLEAIANSDALSVVPADVVRGTGR